MSSGCWLVYDWLTLTHVSEYPMVASFRASLVDSITVAVAYKTLLTRLAPESGRITVR